MKWPRWPVLEMCLGTLQKYYSRAKVVAAVRPVSPQWRLPRGRLVHICLLSKEIHSKKVYSKTNDSRFTAWRGFAYARIIIVK